MKKNSVFTRSMISGRFSPDSEDWLVACLDPFHDYQYSVNGLPDERMAPSVVQIHNQSYTLTAPTSAGSGNWDASVLFTGINSPIGYPAGQGGMMTVTGSNIHPFPASSMSSGLSFGALNIWAGSSGSAMATGAPGTVGDLYASLGSVGTSDRCRLIGVAYEITNTTSALYKQGSITTAMLPDTAADSSMILYVDTDGSWNPTAVQADRALKQASTLPPLLSVPGSATWEAALGAYVVPRMSHVPRDVLTYNYTAGGPSNTGNAGASTRIPILYGTDGLIATPEPTGRHQVSPSTEQALFKPFGPSGFTPCQSFLTGLSNETTLTITFRTIVEYFPALDSVLLPLASPSPVFDPKVLALYGAVAASAPYAVQVGDNATGDYFAKVLSVIGRSLGLIAPVFGDFAPLASLAGSAMTLISKKIPQGEAGPASAQGQGRKLKIQVIKSPKKSSK